MLALALSTLLPVQEVPPEMIFPRLARRAAEALVGSDDIHYHHQDEVVTEIQMDVDGLPPELRSQVEIRPRLQALMPTARFVDVAAGESIELVALRAGADPRLVCWMNAVQPGHVFADADVVCVERFHRVLPGETVPEIAQLYDCTVEELVAEDGAVVADPLQPWRKLYVPAIRDRQLEPQRTYSVRSVNVTFDPQVQHAVQSHEVRQVHQIQEHETLAAIAERHGMDEDRLRLLNGIEPGAAPPPTGTTLVIRAMVRTNRGSRPAHVVAALESMYGYSLEAVLALNDMQRPEDLVGKELVAPAMRAGSMGPGFFGNNMFLNGPAQVIVWDGEVMAAPLLPARAVVLEQAVAADLFLEEVPFEEGVFGWAVEEVATDFAEPALDPAEAQWRPYTIGTHALTGLCADAAVSIAKRMPEGLRWNLPIAPAEAGETLAALATRLGADVEALEQLNDLPRDHVLDEGECVLLGVRHRVLVGENLAAIAELHGVDVADLAAHNGLDPGEEPASGTVLEIDPASLQATRRDDGVLEVHTLAVDFHRPDFHPRNPYLLEAAGAHRVVVEDQTAETLAAELGVTPENLKACWRGFGIEHPQQGTTLATLELVWSAERAPEAVVLWLQGSLGIDWDRTLELNGLANFTELQPGDSLLVPLAGFAPDS